MEQTKQPGRNQTAAFRTLLCTMGLGTLLTIFSTTLLAVVFSLALDGCSKVASRIKPDVAPVRTAHAQKFHR